MKCAKCGAELKEGCLYCSVCGHEAQMVNEYSVLEEDYLKAILTDEASKSSSDSSHNNDNKPQKNSKKQNKQTPWVILICFAAVILVITTGSLLYVRHKNNNSYDYQMEMAEKELSGNHYEKAISYYKNALVLLPSDINARVSLADIYMKQKEYDSAMILYMEILTLDDDNKDAYQGLIRIYESKEEYDKIQELASDITDTDILELFSGYIVAEPVFYPDAGTCDVYTNVTIFSIEECEIYYTLDGSNPTDGGTLYEKDGIELSDLKTYTIKAACKNEKGLFSDVVTAKYKTVALPPDYPEVTPDGGTVDELTFVIITADEGCSIYYTWDGTDPTTASERYTDPIEVPEGNNILSVLVVNDKTNLTSEIYRTNFICKPGTKTAE